MRYAPLILALAFFMLSALNAGESLTEEFSALLQNELSKNEKIKQLEYEIQALEHQSRAESKWDNPSLSFGMSNAQVPTPLNLSANDMQNIFVSVGQNLDINAKRNLQGTITRKQSNIKLLELKSLKNQYILSMLIESINVKKNQQILVFTQDAIKNLDVLMASLHKSSNFNPLQLNKLNLLKAKLQIKQNDIQNQLQTSHIVISEVSFEHTTNLTPPTPDEKALKSVQRADFIKDILQNNYEIQIALLRDSIAKDSLNLAKKSYIGDLTISGSYMYRVSKPDMFALSLSIPLPIYGKERQLVKQGSYENMLSQSGIAEMQNTIKHTAFNLQAKLTNLQENRKLIEDTLLPSNQKISNLYKHHSTSQSSAFLEFYNAMNDEIDTHILRLEMLAQMYIAYWNLRSLKGEI